jgi:isoleucyl-tRNA synthetase
MKKPMAGAEQEVLAFWKKNKTLEKTIANRSEDKVYTFYDGPITANNMPHYGHALTMAVKDVVPRYWTMRGYNVPRSLGWDCQGIPVEYEVEKTLGFKAKEEIEAFGVAKFNQLCRESVEKYSKEIWSLTENMGRWVNKDEEYATMDSQYIESVWWSLKELYKKNLLYEGYKVVPYSTRAGTPLSNSEVALGGYKEIVDPAVTLKFFVKELGVYALAWTTTPWTLPGNLLLAVGNDFDYVVVEFEGTKYLVAGSLVEHVFGSELKVEKTYKGSELVGLDYEPLFNYYLDRKEQGAFKFVAADHVTLDDGTGIVHQAPYGEEDFALMRGMGIEMFDYLDHTCNFTDRIPEYAGLFYKQANKRIMADLTENGKLFKHEDYTHKMPMCWRTDTPLIYKPIKSWYVAVTKITDRLVAENQEVVWVPDHIKDGRFGNWLAGARDWALSRKRYWGTPLPVWINDKTNEIVVVGSFDELEELSGVRLTDPHRPFVDDVTWEDKKNGGVFRRIEDVIDVWYDSGSMPFARLHYPFENKELFEKKYPAQFIAEGIDQTRGWFYTLHVLGVALFDHRSFNHVIVNGMLLAADGTKMSKSKRNYAPPQETLALFGADVLRMYMLSSPIVRAEDICFGDKYLKEMNAAFTLPLMNLVKYFLTYSSTADWSPTNLTKSENIMDKWILERLNQAISQYNSGMEVYELQKAAKELMSFVEDFSKWYVRRSRDRFVNGSLEALSTMYTVLNEYSKLLAPFAPFLAERIYFAVNGLDFETSQDSVHLQDLSTQVDFDGKLLEKMQTTRDIASFVLSIREAKAMKLRQPLQTVYINAKDKDKVFEDILMDEVNVKEVVYFGAEAEVKDSSVEWANGVGLSLNLTDELRKEGLYNDVVRTLQVARKETGCNMGEVVGMSLFVADLEFKKMLEESSAKIAEDLKVNITFVSNDKDLDSEYEVYGKTIKLKVVK